MTTQRQKQKISLTKKNPKTKAGREWWERNIDYYKSRTTTFSLHRENFLKLYRLASGRLNEVDYNYITNPFNETREELLGYPAKIKNYDIIGTIVQLLMGEKGKRPDNKTVIARNSDIKNIRKEQINKEWRQSLIKMFTNELNKIQSDNKEQQANIEAEKIKTLEQIKEEAENLQDSMSQVGQDGLEYIYDFNEIPRKYRKGFYDWLVTARVFSYKGIRNKDTEYEIVSTLDFNYIISEEAEFVEDGEAVWRKKRLTLSEVVDRWGDPNVAGGGLKDKDLTELEANYERSGGNKAATDGFISQTDVFYRSLFRVDERNNDNVSGIEVVHVVWTSMEKLGRRTFTDFFGETKTDEVSEGYKPGINETVKWIWINVPYEAYKIDDKYYVGLQRLQIKRGSFENPNSSKLPYNGRVFGSNHVSPLSIVEKLFPFQIQHNIIHYRGEMTMAKNGDKLIVFPLGLMPNKEGWDMYNTMYYAKASSFLFVDETKPNALAALNGVKIIDLGLGTYIDQISKYLQLNKLEAEESIGISRQRKGAVLASDSVGGTQEAVFRSTVMTEELFVQYEEFQQREDQGLLDLSKYAWAGGKKATYINSQEKVAFLEIHPEDYANAEFAVFAKNSGRTLDKLEQMRSTAHAFAQNQASPLTIGKIIENDNFNSMLKELESLEKEIKKNQQAQAEAEQKAEQNKTQLELKIHEDELDFEYYKTNLDNQTSLEEVLLKNEAAITLKKGDGSDTTIDKILSDISTRREDLQLQREKLRSEERRDKEKNRSAERIAKLNKNRFDTKQTQKI